MAGIATIRGTAIVPGVSRNRRLYTREVLAAAVARAQERIRSGPPLTMLTHHGAEDDSSRIVGRLTALEQRDDGSLAFTAELADTQHGRDLAALVTGDSPFLEGVSIRGWWDGEVRTVQHNGQRVETADSLTLDGLDFTKTPGVPGARVEGSGELARESADGRVLVYESVTEASAKPLRKPYGDVAYADPGYRDGVKRYPIDTAKHAKAAWSYINQADNARLYTAAQLKRIKGRIRAALRRFGVTVSQETDTRFGEIAEYYGDTSNGQGGFCIDAYNGPTCLTLRVAGIDPAELRVIAAAAMDAAVSALAALDPDMDADIDVPGAPHADTDGDMEAASGRPDDDQMETHRPVYVAAGSPATQEHWDLVRRAGIPTPPGTVLTAAMVNQAIDALAQTAPAAPVGETITPQEVPAVSEQPTNAAVAEAATTQAPAATITLTQEQFGALLDRIGTAPAAPAAPATETAAPVAETQEQMVARLVTAGVATAVESLKADLRTEMQQAGPQRRGLAIQTKTSESDMPTDKPFHELPVDQRDQLEKDALLRAFGFAK
jgi:hypothetical protein